MPLSPDKTTSLGGLTVKEYLLTKHNPNKIDMPTAAMPKPPIGVTVHNTDWINVASNTTPAEQYTRATVNGNMRTVRVHYYVDDKCAWQNLPETLSGWHAADGNGNGNRKTIAIECIMKNSSDATSLKSEDNCAKLAAYLLHKYGLTVESGLFTHTHWLNVKDGKSGSNDFLNTNPNPYKNCPAYILPHWNSFKSKVQNYMNKLSGDKTPVPVPTPTPTPTPTSTINTHYQVYAGKWYPEVVNCTDYAGVENKGISGLAARADKGSLTYRVHLKNGGWLSWIAACNPNDWNKGCAGIRGREIDGIQMKLNGVSGYEVQYRVSYIGSTNYLPWVTGTADYAGIFKKTIDKVQIKIIKK